MTNTIEKFISKGISVHGNRYSYEHFAYQGVHIKGEIVCSEHGIFKQTPNAHCKGQGCPRCNFDSNKLTRDQFIEKAIQLHGETYDYSQFVYDHSKAVGIIICKEHGLFEQSPNSHLKGHGCRKCGNLKISVAKQKTYDEFVQIANIIHNNLYDYSNFVYKGCHKKGSIVCVQHGSFEQSPSSHLGGRGCPFCGIVKRNKTLTSTYDIFTHKARAFYDEKYDYSNFIYVDSKTLGIIGCQKHGMFEQTPSEHLRPSRGGCPSCKIEKHFLTQARLLHNDIYDYSDVCYTDSRLKISIRCKTHGVFEQTPSNHLQGRGCPYCSYRVSKPETEWLDSLGVPLRQHSILVNDKRMNVDGYDPCSNTVYQFHGDYWHGNPEVYDPNQMNDSTHCTMRELYERTLMKDKLIKESGYNLATVWEKDYYEGFYGIWVGNKFSIVVLTQQ